MFQLWRSDFLVRHKSSSKCSHRWWLFWLVCFYYMSKWSLFNQLWMQSKDLLCMLVLICFWIHLLTWLNRLRQHATRQLKWLHLKVSSRQQVLYNLNSKQKLKPELFLKNQSWHNLSHCLSLRQYRLHRFILCFLHEKHLHRSEYSDQLKRRLSSGPNRLNISHQGQHWFVAILLQKYCHLLTSLLNFVVA